MKKILVIQGGGRPKGNTAQLVDSFIKGVEEAGHSAVFFGRYIGEEIQNINNFSESQ